MIMNIFKVARRQSAARPAHLWPACVDNDSHDIIKTRTIGAKQCDYLSTGMNNLQKQCTTIEDRSDTVGRFTAASARPTFSCSL